MKKLILLVLGITSILSAVGQASLPPAYPITTDTATHPITLPDSCWQMMTDPTGKLTFQQVLQSGPFLDTNRKINYHIRTYWLRYRYINKMQIEAGIAVNASGTGRTDLYIQSEDGSWQHLKSGGDVSWSKRDGLKKAMYIPLSIPAGKGITVYERDHYDYVYRVPAAREGVNVSFTKKVIQQHYVDNTTAYSNIMQDGFLLGLSLLSIMINFYFFRIVREKEFLYFMLFLIAGALEFISILNFDSISIHSGLSSAVVNIAVVFVFLFFMQFIRHLLKTFERFPRWDKYLIIIALLLAAGFFFVGFAFPIFKVNLKNPLGMFTGVVGVIYLVFVLITLLLPRHEKRRIIKLLIIAVLPLACQQLLDVALNIVVYVFYLKYLSKLVQLLDNPGFVVCFSWLIIVFSWALFLRFSMLRKKLAQQETEKEKERSALIAQQKVELEKQVTERTSELKQSLTDLKSAQKQLIQSEKMASMGELTAGIAHEIQNPLNFVNNFSEVSVELIDEMKTDIDKGNMEEVKNISNDLTQNLQKINFHGKRADAIVKSMLQHSRGSSGQKQLTDINALADEYLRLSYHGLRARDKSFNATMKTNFDGTLERINVVPQDIGRVLLNLFNNAFYAVAEKKKQQPENYEPTVWVSTKRIADGIPSSGGTRGAGAYIEIRVKDNGNGIPEKIKDKIFQPFFTTKPTGEGTGLGLSLSYDMIKAHDGDIKVISEDGKARPDARRLNDSVGQAVGRGTEFVVTLPAG